MNIGISDSSDSGNSEKILFFTAKLDERARIIVPAAIRRKLGISVGAVVFVGVEKVKGSGDAVNVSEKGCGEKDEN